MDTRLIAELISIGVGILAIASMQFKSMTLILLFQIGCNTLISLTYALKDAMSGAGICLIAVVQTVLVFFFQKKNKTFPIYLTGIFVVLYIACSAMTAQGWVDIFSAAAAICYALSVVQTKPSVYRIFMLGNALLWTAYDITAKATIILILTHSLLALSGLIAMVRLDRKDWKAFFDRLAHRADPS